MSFICSVGLGIPSNELSQPSVKNLVREIFTYSERLLPVFDHAMIDKRQFVVGEDWFKEKHSFQEKNDLYHRHAINYSLQAMDACLANKEFLKQDIPYEAIDLIIFVSSTGIATPSLDTYLMNERPFREDIARMPLWGLGCAGGAIGLSRAFDWLTAHPDKTVLIITCELCSLTFQKDDNKKSNLIGTALFGDGVGAALLVGENSTYLSYVKKVKPQIINTSSVTMKNSNSVMGWDITNDGLEVVFSKSIPALVQTFWKKHIETFLQDNNINRSEIYSFIAHPGGKKVLEAMEDVLQVPQEKFKHSYRVLRKHGNMSSATVFYILHEWLKEGVPEKEKSILSALGPGFSSELLILEWSER
ncbi:type III polyketide synthase [Virgibacillus litoralis]|uniref:Alkylresorcinol/alkylpyrone synthase n=1 Tax=Virgibacillus litoralis TaxID=578221 RepID=A0ABS4HFW1_9BACI|nr:3-oxoacyl-[acyl-carrier-protein] synthase III C-terminal domain-containing protein [Virgibacillus litoralis]MBP1949609.1 alkylresorcinol/alkylpyrone synthase [Virgibacillus litoralis]